ncbi:hypothetical protein H4R34_004325 [Dimargaris verticillata]|uniref:Uncharacterized protein n=1 Tax=Dimargaris verticillata TaxID=2761393 RepID=A0A9W8AZ31_9FUNG|nr:hypothetical protein H4R34_004325 [Dimargaris verticillata]
MVSTQFYAAQRRLGYGCIALSSLLMVTAIIMLGVHTRIARKKYMGHKKSRALIYGSWGLLLVSSVLLCLGMLLSLINVNRAEKEDHYGQHTLAAPPPPPAAGIAQSGAYAQPTVAPGTYRSAQTPPPPPPAPAPAASPHARNDDAEVHVQFPQPTQ